MGKRGSRGHVRQLDTVVTLVHGTFARDAAWTRPDSALSTALTEAGCHVIPFPWSGKNSHRARSHAAQQLAGHLNQQIENNPRARQWIVAHSHGGNVALHAAFDVRRSRCDASRVSTIALATPFIHARARAISGWSTFLAILFGVFLLAAAAYKAVTGPHSFLDWMLIATGAVFIAEMVLCAVGASMHGRFVRQDYRSQLIASVHAPAVDPEDVVVVRAAGDEASGFLTAGQFVGWTSAVLSRLLTNLVFWSAIILAMQLSVFLSVVLDLSPLVFIWSLYVFTVAGFTVVGAVAAMLGASMVFGVDGPFVCLFASSSAEAAPPGKATLLQLEPFAATGRRELAHSRLYDDEKVIRGIVETIRNSSAN